MGGRITSMGARTIPISLWVSKWTYETEPTNYKPLQKKGQSQKGKDQANSHKILVGDLCFFSQVGT